MMVLPRKPEAAVSAQTPWTLAWVQESGMDAGPVDLCCILALKRSRTALAASGVVIPVEATEEPDLWFRESSQRLEGLGALRRNWDSYGAEPPNNTALYWAERVVELLRDMAFRPCWLDPAAEGGIMIAFRDGSRFGSIECYNTGTIVALTSDGQGNIEAWPLAQDESAIEEALARIRRYVRG